MSPQAHRLTDFLSDLQQLEKAAFSTHGRLILDAFTRHTPFDTGAVYLRDARGAILRLAAKSEHCLAPDTLDSDGSEGAEQLPLEPRPHVVIPIRSSRDHFGVVALSGDPASEDDLEILRAAGSLDVVSRPTTPRR